MANKGLAGSIGEALFGDRRRRIESEELALEAAREKLKQTQLESVPLSESLTTPRVKAILGRTQSQDIPLSELISGEFKTKEAGIEEARQEALRGQKEFGELTPSQFKEFQVGRAAVQKPDIQLDKEARAEQRRLAFEARIDLRRMATEQRAEDRAIRREERADKMVRFRVDPTIKHGYTDLNKNIKLGENLEDQLQSAIGKGYNITGLFSAPVNRFREIIGRMPPEDQTLLTSLRLNFADFVRERGGTAFTPTEKEVFAPIVPSEGDDENTNLNKVRDMLDILKDKKIILEEDYPALKLDSSVISETTPAPAPAPAPPPTSAQKTYRSPLEIKKAVMDGKLSKDQARSILQDQFGFK